MHQWPAWSSTQVLPSTITLNESTLEEVWVVLRSYGHHASSASRETTRQRIPGRASTATSVATGPTRQARSEQREMKTWIGGMDKPTGRVQVGRMQQGKTACYGIRVWQAIYSLPMLPRLIALLGIQHVRWYSICASIADMEVLYAPESLGDRCCSASQPHTLMTPRPVPPLVESLPAMLSIALTFGPKMTPYAAFQRGTRESSQPTTHTRSGNHRSVLVET